MYLPFENIQIAVPARYDEVLRIEYGEYMMPVRAAAEHEYPFYRCQEEGMKNWVKSIGFLGSVDEFCRNMASGRLKLEVV